MKAFITGATGQDGSYLAELLLSKGYEVHGMKRAASLFNTERVDHLLVDPNTGPQKYYLHFGDLTDGSSVRSLLEQIQPDEIYNLGAQSHVGVSFYMPVNTADVIAMGTLMLLNAMKDICPNARFYQASSSEMFGDSPAPQNELTRFSPLSPYACAKVMAHHLAVNYRKAYGLHISCGILFNHESSRRHITFVTRKITNAAARIKLGLQDKIYLGNIDAKRDWGYAGDYVEAMYLMLQRINPDDYVIATGEMHSVRELLDKAFGILGLDWTKHVVISDRYKRPSDVPELCGDASKAAIALGWYPKVKFDELIETMVISDLKLAEKEKLCLKG